MYSSVTSAAYYGLHGYTVDVETHIANGLPRFKIVGLPGKSVEEARERVTAAIKSSGYTFPLKRITVNLSPTNIPKSGSALDLPIAISILIASKQIRSLYQAFPEKVLIAGELGLDGSIRTTSGLPIIIQAGIDGNISNFVIPSTNSIEYSLPHIRAYKADTLENLIHHIQQKRRLDIQTTSDLHPKKRPDISELFSLISGRDSIKRTLLISAAGRHSLSLSGPPGCGKTLFAQATTELLPDLSVKEHIDLLKIYSLSNTSPPSGRPFRNPHHTSSKKETLGGGTTPLPGEISKAQWGILFLDEFPEFDSAIIRSLRAVLDTKEIMFTRTYASVTYPADFILITSMNRCRCGLLGHPYKRCKCRQHQIEQYQSRVPHSLWDRIDLHQSVTPQKELFETVRSSSSVSADIADIRGKVKQTWQIQSKRGKPNSSLTLKDAQKYCKATPSAKILLRSAYTKFGMSTRNLLQTLRVARTIADLDRDEILDEKHIEESLAYRRAF